MKNKYDLDEKQAVLMAGIVAEYEQARRKSFKEKDNGLALDQFEERVGRYTHLLCKSVSDSKYRKRINIEKRFKDIVYTNNAIFVTLTFNDETLAKTSEETRRQYVRKYLKKQCRVYVANIDFGDKEKNPDSNEREHYHALVMARDKDKGLDLSKWAYGIINAKRVRYKRENVQKVSKYVAKLSQHALKKSGRLPRLIWSRGFDSFEFTEDELLPF